MVNGSKLIHWLQYLELRGSASNAVASSMCAPVKCCSLRTSVVGEWDRDSFFEIHNRLRLPRVQKHSFQYIIPPTTPRPEPYNNAQARCCELRR